MENLAGNFAEPLLLRESVHVRAPSVSLWTTPWRTRPRNAPVNEHANELWQKVLDSLRGRVGEQVITKLLSPLVALDAADGVLLLRAQNDFTREWVSKGYVTVIEEQLRYLTGQTWSVHWAASVNTPVVAPKPAPAPAQRYSAPRVPQGSATASSLPSALNTAPRAPSATASTGPLGAPVLSGARPAPAVMTARPGGATSTSATSSTRPAAGAMSAGLAPKYVFDRFVTGKSNEVAHAMALALSNPGARPANVLFLCGATGLGKTHLSNAVGHRILEQKPDARIIYVSAETFTNDYVQAIQQKKMDEFRARYRSEADALLIDDVQFLAGKEGTQEEFFHTFEALCRRNAAIVLTSDVLPDKLQGMAERLVSRFSQALVAEIYAPDEETRVAILRRKAELENVRIDDGAAFLIARSAQLTNVRELEGALMKLAIKAGISGRASIDEALVRETLRVAPRPQVITVEDVQRAVCEHYRIKLNQLTGKDRHREVALPRQVAMWLARVHLGTSFPQIGARFNGKDHTTVISAVRKVEKLVQEDPEVTHAVELIARKLGFAQVLPRTGTADGD